LEKKAFSRRSDDNFEIGWYPDVIQQELVAPLSREFLPHVLRYDGSAGVGRRKYL
jgi:hypothetical protein